jgi:hypothetical protein
MCEGCDLRHSQTKDISEGKIELEYLTIERHFFYLFMINMNEFGFEPNSVNRSKFGSNPNPFMIMNR